MFDEDDGERGGGKATERNAGIGDRVALPLGTNSETSAAVVASSTPTPRPVTKRKRPNMIDEYVNAVAAIPSENQA